MAYDLNAILPADFAEGRFLGRAMAPEGPVVISIRDGVIYDLTSSVASVAGAIARREFDGGTVIGPVADPSPLLRRRSLSSRSDAIDIELDRKSVV